MAAASRMMLLAAAVLACACAALPQQAAAAAPPRSGGNATWDYGCTASTNCSLATCSRTSQALGACFRKPEGDLIYWLACSAPNAGTCTRGTLYSDDRCTAAVRSGDDVCGYCRQIPGSDLYYSTDCNARGATLRYGCSDSACASCQYNATVDTVGTSCVRERASGLFLRIDSVEACTVATLFGSATACGQADVRVMAPSGACASAVGSEAMIVRCPTEQPDAVTTTPAPSVKPPPPPPPSPRSKDHSPVVVIAFAVVFVALILGGVGFHYYRHGRYRRAGYNPEDEERRQQDPNYDSTMMINRRPKAVYDVHV